MLVEPETVSAFSAQASPHESATSLAMNSYGERRCGLASVALPLRKIRTNNKE